MISNDFFEHLYAEANTCNQKMSIIINQELWNDLLTSKPAIERYQSLVGELVPRQSLSNEELQLVFDCCCSVQIVEVK